VLPRQEMPSYSSEVVPLLIDVLDSFFWRGRKYGNY